MMPLKSVRFLSLLVLIASTTACTTISDWFADEEELEIRRLVPIEEQFAVNEVWDASVGGGVDEYFSRLQPVLQGDTLYVADRRGLLVAIDATSGKRKWSKDFSVYRDQGFFSNLSKLWSRGETARLSSLAYANGKLYVGSENGYLLALNADDGEQVWKVTVAGEILAPASVDAQVVVINTTSGAMFAFSEETGEQLWRSDSDVPPLSLRGISSPLATNGGVLVGTATGHLRVSVIDSGLTAWETAIATPTGATELERIVDIDATPLVYGGSIYTVAYNGTLASVEFRSGRIVWKREYGSFRNITLDGNRLFVVDVNSNIYALDRRNGVELWTQRSIKGRRLTSAVPFGDHVVVGDNYGYLHWINQQTGEIEARYELGSDDEDESIFSDPIVYGDKLIALTREGDIAAVIPGSSAN